MVSTTRSKDNVTESLSNLTLDSAATSTKSSKYKSSRKVVDSWEDEDELSGSDDERKPAIACSITPSAPSAPSATPTPITGPTLGWDDAINDPASPRGENSPKRPEKTDAVARRMIAASLGLKAPKQTEEQKAYQRAVREQEKKKRDLEKMEEQRRREEAEKAKAAVWED